MMRKSGPGNPAATPGSKVDNDVRAWCEKTWPAVYRYVYRLVQNREEAEDLTQETYLRTVRKGFPQGNPPSMGYLATVALNLVRDSWRRKSVRVNTSPLEKAALNVATAEEDAPSGDIIELLSCLPDEYREVLDLRIIQGYSRAETATRMGKTEGAVRGLQYRALVALRKLMDENLKEVEERESRQ